MVFIIVYLKKKKCKKSDNNGDFKAKKHIFFKKYKDILVYFWKKIKNGFYSGGLGQKIAKKCHFFVKKWAMGARKFPLTIFFRLLSRCSHDFCFFLRKKGRYSSVFLLSKKPKKSQIPTRWTERDGVFQKKKIKSNKSNFSR